MDGVSAAASVVALIETSLKVVQAWRPGATRLFTSRSLNDLIQKCLIHLKHLQKKLEPGKNRKAISRCEIRALKWPFERKELEKDIGVLERYKSIVTAILNIDQI